MKTKKKKKLEKYHKNLPAAHANRLYSVQQALKEGAPDAELTFRNGMPTLRRKTTWIAFASENHQIAIHAGDNEHLAPYLEKHPRARHSYGTLIFEDRDAIDYDALTALARALFA